MSGEYQQGLFGCFGNCKVCICTICCPCYVYGKVAEKVGDSCLICGCVFFLPIADLVCRCMTRQKVREQKGIPGSAVSDFLVSWCCFPCSLCQDANEVSALDMSASMAREQKPCTMFKFFTEATLWTQLSISSQNIEWLPGLLHSILSSSLFASSTKLPSAYT